MEDEEKAQLLARAKKKVGRPAWTSPYWRFGRPPAPITREEARTLKAEGYSIPQIAEIFGVSTSTVERRLGMKY